MVGLTILFAFIPGDADSGSSFLGNANFKVGEISIVGNIIFSEEKLKQIFPGKGTKFNKELFEKNIEQIISFYSDQGFPFIKIKLVEFSLDSSYINWKLMIEPGRLQKINNFLIEGLSYTSSDYLRGKIRIRQTDIFSESKISGAINDLNKIDYIDVDSFKLVSTEDEDWVDVIVFLRERTGGSLNGVLSYSNNGGFSGLVAFNNSNFFGKGREIDIKLEREGDKYQNEIFEYTEPAIFSLPLNLNLSLSHDFIKDYYNLISFSTGFEFFYNEASFFSMFGMELISSVSISESYPFLVTGFSYKSSFFNIYFKEKFRRSRGWDLETSADFSIFFALLKLEYFKLSYDQGNLTLFKSFRGYPGIAVKEGAVVGLEFRSKLGLLTIYPFVDANFFYEDWQYSYGLGMKIRKFTLEFAVPKGISPSEGRVYFRFQ